MKKAQAFLFIWRANAVIMVLVVYEPAASYESLVLSVKDFSRRRREKIVLPGSAT